MSDILVLGNINADWVFRLDEPLHPGLETTGQDLGLRPGGAAANAASALAATGNHVRLVGFVGSDETGARLLKAMADDGRDWDLSRVVSLEGSTPACLILIDPQGERVIVGTHRNTTQPHWPEIDVEGLACVYVASRWGAPAPLLERLETAGVPVVSQWRPGYTVKNAEALVVSEDELPAEALGDPWQAARVEGLSPGWIVVTQGARGAWATDGETRLFCPAPAVDVVDTTGAGDAFAAGLVHGFTRAWPMAACLAQGVAWGSRAVRHLGSTFPKSDLSSSDDFSRLPGTEAVRYQRYAEVTSV